MSKYYKAEDIEREIVRLLQFKNESDFGFGITHGIETVDRVLKDLPTIEVSEDCVSRKWLEEYKEVISYKNMWHMTEIDEFVSWENIEDAPSVIPQVSNEDAISREYMLRALNGYGKDWQEDCEIAEIIRNAPSVTPKPKDGEWIIHKINGIPHTVECLHCHQHYDYEELRHLGRSKGCIDIPHCPNCGAKMKGADDES